MKWFSLFSYRTFYYRSIAALIVGIVALFVPHDTLQTLVMLIGAFILIAGIGTAIAAHKAGHNFLLSLAGTASLVSIIIGIFLLVRPDLFVKIIVTLFGILLIVVGLMQLINVANIKNKMQNATFYIIAGVIPLIMGAVFLMFPHKIEGVIGIILGITLIIYALNELGLGFKMRKFFKTKVEDVEFEEVKE